MLINCAAYQGGRKLRDLTIAEISDFVEQPDCFVWVALRDATHDELELMRVEFGLHPLAVEDAQKGHQRPKIEEYGETLFAVVHLLEAYEGRIEVGELNVFAGKNFVLSVRNRNEQNFLGVRERCQKEPELLQQGSGFVLYALIDAAVDRYFPVLDELETELEEIEGNIFVKGSARQNIERLYNLKRRIMILRHAVAPLEEELGKLSGRFVPSICMNSREYFRDVYDHLTRISTSIDSIRDTIGVAIQVSLSAVTIEESEVQKRLAAWAGIFAVVTAFAGIWGMNYKNMPELQWEYGYPFALSCMALCSGFLYWRFRKVGWL